LTNTVYALDATTIDLCLTLSFPVVPMTPRARIHCHLKFVLFHACASSCKRDQTIRLVYLQSHIDRGRHPGRRHG